MFSRLQKRPRTLFLAILAVTVIVVGSVGVTHIFANTPVKAPAPTAVAVTPHQDGGSISRQLNWSDPTTWKGGVPGAGSSVTIPAKETVRLDTSPPPLKSLTIQGTLICTEKNLALSADWIIVASTGVFQCGTESKPFQHHIVITLTGSDQTQNVMGMGTKLLGVVGGNLELHGQSRVSWVHLAATAFAGTTQLQLDQTVNWSKGDRIVLASTDYDPFQAEELVIASASGTTVTLTQPLKYMHWGQLQTFAGQTIDERAEVGLLSHNIVVQGDPSSVKTGFGGQSMFMSKSSVHISDVEFYHMGQFRKLARYPVHWHLAGNETGNYIQDSTVDHSFNRCMTIHGTNDVLVRDNVAFDDIGHCYFLEDGSETKNTLEGNLGVLTRSAPDGENLLPSDTRPATFWITNPDNIIRDNVAAGSVSQGFWFSLPEHPLALDSGKTNIWPRQTPLGLFSGNVAHSNGEAGLFVDDGPNADNSIDGYYYTPVKTPGDENSAPVDAFFQNFTAYKQAFLGVWMRGYYLHLTGAKLADNDDGGIFAADKAYLENSLVVGETANKGNPDPGDPRGLDGRSLPDPSDPTTPVNGFSFYDGLVGVKDVTFVNFQSNSQRPAGALGYNRQNSDPIDVMNFAQGIHLINANAVYLMDPTQDGDKAAVILDSDGSLTGHAGQYVTANNPLLADGSCTLNTTWNAYVCNHRYVNVAIESDGGQDIAPLTIVRDDGVKGQQLGQDGTYVSVSALPGHTYTWQFANSATTLQIDLSHAQASDTITLVIPYATANVQLYRDAEQDDLIGAVNSMSSFSSTTGSKYFYDSTQNLLYIKLVPQAGNDWARVNVAPG